MLGAIQAIAALRLPVRVVAYLPLAENMPSGSAQRPSDVLTMFGGTTVEVTNTDAEGRLVLADVLAASAADSPDILIDVATLTGAQIVALGPLVAGVMSNDDGLREAVVDAARRAGEAMWPMPLPAELGKGLESAVADLANLPADGRGGGMLVAGLFLQEFVPDGPAGRTWISRARRSGKRPRRMPQGRNGCRDPDAGPDRAGHGRRAALTAPRAGFKAIRQ